MKIKKLSFVICFLSLFLSFFCFSTIYDLRSMIVLAVETPAIPIPATDNSALQTDSALQNEQQSLIERFLSWLKSLSTIAKTDYKIDPKTTPNPKKFTNYGNMDNPDYKNDPFASSNRYVFSDDQFCYKGQVILNVLSGDEPDTPVVSDPNTNCGNIKISTLALYKLQNNQPFYCDENKQKVTISEDIKAKIIEMNIGTSLVSDSSCYENTLKKFYLADPNLNKKTEEKVNSNENLIKIASQPIFKDKNNPNPKSVKEIQKKAVKEVTFKGQKRSLNVLKFKPTSTPNPSTL